MTYHHGTILTIPPLLTLSKLFAKLSTENPLCLEHLSAAHVDVTVDQVIKWYFLAWCYWLHFSSKRVGLPCQSVWTSFLVNNIRLTNVEIGGITAKEMMLSSYSGLKRLVLNTVTAHSHEILENLENMFFADVIPKHVNSLQTLRIDGDTNKIGWNRLISLLFSLTESPLTGFPSHSINVDNEMSQTVSPTLPLLTCCLHHLPSTAYLLYIICITHTFTSVLPPSRIVVFSP
jgi:hypothetical protein